MHALYLLFPLYMSISSKDSKKKKQIFQRHSYIIMSAILMEKNLKIQEVVIKMSFLILAFREYAQNLYIHIPIR